MKTQMVRMLLALGTVSLFGGALHAQTYDLVANVPFKFQVSNQTLDAGKYLVQQNQEGVATLRSMANGHATFIVGAYARLGKATTSKLVFHCYNGRDCFLTELWPDRGNGSGVPMSKAEKAIVRGEQAKEMATIAIEVRRAD